MYINYKSLCLTRPLSKLEYYRYITKCSLNNVLNGSSTNFTKLNNRRSRFFVTTFSRNLTLNDTYLNSYLRNKETTYNTEIDEASYISLYDKFKQLYHDDNISLDSICFELNYKEDSYNFLNHTNSYPQHSESQDGHINISLTNNNLYFDNINDIGLSKYENAYMNRKLVPATLLPISKSYIVKSRNKTSDYSQLLFDNNCDLLVDRLYENECLSMVEILFSLNNSISYKHLCLLLQKGLNSLWNLSTEQLVKLAISVRGYLDSDSSYLNYYLVRIGNILEQKLSNLNEYSKQNLIDYLFPLSLMQISEHPVQWSLLTNYQLLNKMTENIDELDPNYQGKLLVILSSLESCPDVSSKYYKTYEGLINSLTENMDSVHSKVIMNMMHMPILFHTFEMFREKLYSQTKSRWVEFPVNTLASIYNKRKDDIPKEFSDYLLNRFPSFLNIILPKYVPELFCSFLNEGVPSSIAMNAYKNSIGLYTDTLSAKNISNILMYLSIHGKTKIDFYTKLVDRFSNLKKEKNLNNEEILDLVLSMSLVGIQNRGVWHDVDLTNLVYGLPRNILVYLGYSFLITNVNQDRLWKILLERILNENKSLTPETYEVLKAAQILEFINEEGTNNKFNNLLKGSRATFLARQVKQRYKPNTPYKVMFKHLGIKYYEDHLIDDLYEAKYYIPEFKLIISPVQNYFFHPTSSMIPGDLILRRKVWEKLKYKCYFFTDKKWKSYYNENDKENSFWDIDEFSKAFLEETKLDRIFKEREERNAKYLKLKGKPVKIGQLKNIQPKQTHLSRVRMFQNIMVHENKKD